MRTPGLCPHREETMGGNSVLSGAAKAPTRPAAKLRKPDGGFALISVTKLAMLWWSYRTGLIKAADLRVALACHVALASRCRMKPGESPSFTHAELARTCGAGERSIRSSLARLKRSGLLSWSESAIVFTDSPDALRSDDLVDFFAMLESIPNRKRLVPVPRRMLRFLADGASATLIATVLGLLLRCLYYWPDEGCRSHGSCKASWIAETFGVSLRGVKASRKELVALGWLIRKEAPQWRMNRGGLSVEINLAWTLPSYGTLPPCGSVSSSGEAPSREKTDSEFAPPPAPICTAFAPPDSDKELSFGESKNQKPAPLPGRGAGQTGFSISERAGEKNPEAKPTLRDVTREDLRDTGRLLELHAQAIASGLLGSSERERLLFIAAAEHARSLGKKNPPGLFMRLVRSKLWSFITQDDEDRANARLKTHLFGKAREEGNSGEPRISSRPSSTAPTLSPDARIVQAVRAAAQRAGFRGDPFYLIRRERPDWTRERWDAAVSELEGRRRSGPKAPAMTRVGELFPGLSAMN